MAVETELKLRFDPAHLARLRAHPLLQNSREHALQSLENTYFDTPDFELLRQRLGLRVRRDGSRLIQALKTAGSGLGGLHQRQEWESEVDRPEPAAERFPTEARTLLDASVWQRVRGVFDTHFQRELWLLQDPAGHCVELCIDQGEIRAGGRSQPLHEVELELKAGDPAQLYVLARQLLQAAPLWLENRSKSQRGYALAGVAAPPVAELRLGAQTPARAALATALQYWLQALPAAELAVAEQRDPDPADLRRHLCRLQTVLECYHSLGTDADAAALAPELAWLERATSAAAHGQPAELRHALRSQRCTALLLDFGALLLKSA